MYLKGAHSIAYHTVGRHNALQARLLQHTVHEHDQNRICNRTEFALPAPREHQERLVARRVAPDGLRPRPAAPAPRRRALLHRARQHVRARHDANLEIYFSGGRVAPRLAAERVAPDGLRPRPATPTPLAGLLQRARPHVLAIFGDATLEIYFSGGPRRHASATRRRASRSGRTPSSPGYARAATPGSSTTSASTRTCSSRRKPRDLLLRGAASSCLRDSLPSESLRTDSVLARLRHCGYAGLVYNERVNTCVLPPRVQQHRGRRDDRHYESTSSNFFFHVKVQPSFSLSSEKPAFLTAGGWSWYSYFTLPSPGASPLASPSASP